MSVDNTKLLLGSFIDTDKVIEVVEGQFTYSYTTSDAGGLFEIPNPQPGTIMLPFSIFSIDSGQSWFGDLDAGTGVEPLIPDLLTCVSKIAIRYRWAGYGRVAPATVIYKTALLATEHQW